MNQLFDHRNDDEIKALSLHQYLASLVSINAKQIETRSFRIKYRGRLAIQAAKTLPKYFDKNGKVELREHYRTSPVTRRLLEKHFGIRRFDELCMLPRGGIVCVVTVVECIQIGTKNFAHPDSIMPKVVRPYLTNGWREFGIYGEGRYLWLLKDIQRLNEVVPCTGYQGMWTLDAATQAAVEKQLSVSKEPANALRNFNASVG
jgi:hypothetical protein